MCDELTLDLQYPIYQSSFMKFRIAWRVFWDLPRTFSKINNFLGHPFVAPLAWKIPRPGNFLKATPLGFLIYTNELLIAWSPVESSKKSDRWLFGLGQKRSSCNSAQMFTLNCSPIIIPNFFLLSVFHWPFSLLCKIICSALPNLSQLGQQLWSSPASVLYWSETPKSGYCEAREGDDSLCHLAVSKMTKFPSAYQTLCSQLWQILDGTARVVQDWDAVKGRENRLEVNGKRRKDSIWKGRSFFLSL